jgi:hypothetical protein
MAPERNLYLAFRVIASNWQINETVHVKVCVQVHNTPTDFVWKYLHINNYKRDYSTNMRSSILKAYIDAVEMRNGN